MITIPPPVFHKRRAIPGDSKPPETLQLIAVDYAQGVSITLAFNQPIDLNTIDPTGLEINDAQLAHASFLGSDSPVTRIGPNAVRIGLDAEGPSSGTQILLNGAAYMNIRAISSAAVWPGVSGLVLPFPPA